MNVINDEGVLVDSEGAPLSLTAEYRIGTKKDRYRITSMHYDGRLRVEFRSSGPLYLQEEHHFIVLPWNWTTPVKRWREPTPDEIAEDVFQTIAECDTTIAPKVEELLRALCQHYGAEEILMRDVSNCSFVRRDPIMPLAEPEIAHVAILQKLRARGVLPSYFDLLDRGSK